MKRFFISLLLPMFFISLFLISSCGDAEHTHSYSSEWCVDVEPTCTAKGRKSRHCTVCESTEITEIEAKSHSPKEPVEENSLEPTCTLDGSFDKVVYCSVCNAEISRETQSIAKLGHNYSLEWTVDVAPDCENEGSKSRHCTACHEKTDITVIEKNAHSFGNWYEIKAPECLKNGTEERECTVCHDKETRSTDALVHIPKPAAEENRVEASCCLGGSYNSVIYCAICGIELSRTSVSVSASGHNPTKFLNCSKCGEKIEYYRDGNFIYFGEYPQSVKEENVTVTSTVDSRGYYLGSDGFYYAKIVAIPYNSSYTFSSGENVMDGEVYYFKVEPIRWRILSDVGESVFILCDSIISCVSYDTSFNNSYKNSNVRAWLNAEFYNTAFTELQKDMILTSTVDSGMDETEFSTTAPDYESTQDKIFLLSRAEAMNSAYGFLSNEDRFMKTSDYSRAIGAYVGEEAFLFNGYWWLRSPSYNYNFVHCVDCDGNVSVRNSYSMQYGVVPALQISLRAN